MANPNRKKYNVGETFKCNNCDNMVLATPVIVRNHNYRCTKCRNLFIEKYQKENPDKQKAWNKKYQQSEAGKAVKNKSIHKYILNNQEKHKAHRLVQTAIRNGTLIKQPCVKCGSNNSQAHHEDYTKPLYVIWYCQLHHKERHKLLKQLSNETT